MALSTKRQHSVSWLRNPLRRDRSTNLNDEQVDDTPWITVQNDSFRRALLKDSIVAFVALTVTTIVFSEILMLADVAIFSSVVDISDLFAALSVITVLVVGIAGYTTGKTTAKRAHTVSILSEATSNERLFKALLRTRCMSPDQVKVCADADPLDLMANRDVVQTLSFYEFVASACNSDDVDANVVLKVRGDAMSNTAAKFEPFIEAVRDEYGDEIYKAFTNLVSTYDLQKEAWLDAHDTPSPD